MKFVSVTCCSHSHQKTLTRWLCPLLAGDSHSLALTEQGAVYGWGTYRNTQGVYGFSPTQRIAASPTLVYVSPGVTPAAAQHDQIIQIAAGESLFVVSH